MQIVLQIVLNYEMLPGEFAMLTQFTSYSKIEISGTEWQLDASDLSWKDEKYRNEKRSCPIIVIASHGQTRLVITEDTAFWLGGGLKEA